METNQREGEGVGGKHHTETETLFRFRRILVNRRWRFEDVWVRNFFNCVYYNYVYYSYFFAVVIDLVNDTIENRTDKFSFAVH